MANRPYIVIAGNPVDGFEYVGPFASNVEAEIYANNDPHIDGCDAWIAAIDPPISEAQRTAELVGYDVAHDLHGFYVRSCEDQSEEERTQTSTGFDGRAHFETTEAAWEEAARLATE